jgi:hypothetical protein
VDVPFSDLSCSVTIGQSANMPGVLRATRDSANLALELLGVRCRKWALEALAAPGTDLDYQGRSQNGCDVCRS